MIIQHVSLIVLSIELLIDKLILIRDNILLRLSCVNTLIMIIQHTYS